MRVEEKTIIEALIILGILILVFSIAIQFYIKNTISGFLTPLSPDLLCYKDNQSKYILTKPLAEGGCNEIDNYHDMIEFIDCTKLQGEKQDACAKMVEIVKVKTNECIKDLFLGYNRTIIDDELIEQYCSILLPINITT